MKHLRAICGISIAYFLCWSAPTCFAIHVDQGEILSEKQLQMRGQISHDAFVVNAVPKCGTHLLTKCIYFMINKQVDEGYDYNAINTPNLSSYVALLKLLKECPLIHKTHVPYSREIENGLLQAGLKSVFIFRDPRDAIVSLVFYMERMSGNQRDFMQINSEIYNPLDLNEKIEALMTGSCCTDYMNTYLKAFLGWTRTSFGLVVKFEDLIGPRGGGTTEKQLRVIDEIASYLNVKLSYEEKVAIAEHTNHFKTSAIQNALSSHYSHGRIGNWKHYFNDSNIQLFKQLFGNELIELGYEQDNNW